MSVFLNIEDINADTLDVKKKSFLNGDVSMGSRLFLNNDASFGGNAYIGSNTIINGDVLMNSRLFINGDVSMNSRLFLTSDISMGGRLFINSDVSINGNMYTLGTTIQKGDVSMNSRLFVSSDVSLNADLYVAGDVSINGRLNIGNDINISGNIIPTVGYKYNLGSSDSPFNSLYISSNTIYFNNKTNGNTVSLSINELGTIDIFSNNNISNNQKVTTIVSSNGNVGLGKTIGSATLDVSGTMSTFGDVSMNSRLYITDDVTINSR
jgi:predicted acyltransferase (DUF342 family)